MVRVWRSRTLQSCIWLICINLVIRGLWLAVMHPPQYYDFDWYFTHAVDMVHGKGYQMYGTYTAYWPMGYPYFLSILFRLTGPHVIAGLIANALLSTGIVVLVYLMSLQLFKVNRIALISALAYTLLPSQIEWNSVLGSEELFTFLALLSLYTYVSVSKAGEKLRCGGARRGALRRHPLVIVALAGLFLGIACDVRPIPFLFPIAIFAYEVWIRRTPITSAFVRVTVFSAAMLAGVCPLTIRNFVALHHFVLVSTNGGVNLWQGTKTNGSYYWTWNPSINPLVPVVKNQILENQIGTHVAVQYMLHHPVLTIVNGIQKLFFLYWVDWNVVGVTFAVLPGITQSGVRFAMWFDTIAYWLWMTFAVYGLVGLLCKRAAGGEGRGRAVPDVGAADGRVADRGDRDCGDADRPDTDRTERGQSVSGWRMAALPIFFIVYNSAVFFFFPAWDRFRYPMMPLWALFFAFGWIKLVRKGSTQLKLT